MATPLQLLRQEMLRLQVQAVIVPSNDTHFSEYVSAHFKCRGWLTGFDGSAGTAVVTTAGAALFTDSRYFLQAEAQLSQDFVLQKQGLTDSISEVDFIKKTVANGTVGVNASLYSAKDYEKLQQDVQPLQLKNIGDVFAAIWADRPALPTTPAFLLDVQFAGKSIAQKLAAVKSLLNPPAHSVYVVTALDQTAWLLNLRGGDVAYTPVALAYTIVDWDSNSLVLFIDRQKISAETLQLLEKQQVTIDSYSDFEQQLPHYTKGKTVQLHPQFTSHSAVQIIAQNAAKILPESGSTTCINLLKAQKNEVEIAGVQQAMIYDGAAWVKFWFWLEQNVDIQQVTEISAAQQLRQFRAAMPHFLDESFAPIVGYGEHGAIVHYSATPAGNARIVRDNFVLIDTGGQYRLGTTDITRTLHLGTPTAQQKRDYTLVLKGHIALSTAVFAEGTRGAQLDMLARQPMLKQHLHYMHGTGHGVGHCLSVHEGPQSIRLNENPALLQKGMITSCEPGLYRSGQYGIRIENLVLTVDSGSSEFGNFYKFEPLTLCPYDLNSIDLNLLDAVEKEYVNNYHSTVYKKINDLLTAEERAFLEQKCRAIAV
ncbi:Xaa-Pro aminopeptidase [Bacteroidia bacterium]|nr:Xaa-Pro aminopeptidase [Bacteroidia bacterium]